jgi:hypothetical protein
MLLGICEFCENRRREGSAIVHLREHRQTVLHSEGKVSLGKSLCNTSQGIPFAVLLQQT